MGIYEGNSLLRASERRGVSLRVGGAQPSPRRVAMCGPHWDLRAGLGAQLLGFGKTPRGLGLQDSMTTAHVCQVYLFKGALHIP